ncbi:hypothetical protein B0H16DRAFT_1703913 [Mycena metata]|uniref:G domain-containing protein n=1 Tax=Mycena metata TaxID=1033252 RepID=A0AAD7H027_9AGAR|nr:hypothetical protein B0H16DRAFT_1703913 [Mycena metata]
MTSQADSSARDDSPVKSMPDLKFRVLILGRANAGKTTILERIAGAAVSEAEVWRGGERSPASMIKGQSDRGFHNVEDELRFPSRPGFVFHDSRGIESGSAEELETLRKFVEIRSSTNSIHEQLHAIWMCVPLDESRELFQGERAPLSWSKEVAPLVVIFTKHDGAVLKETSKIMEQMTKDSSVTTISRSAKNRVRGEAHRLVTHRINELKGELSDFSPHKDTLGFLTAGGMQECTDETEKTCQELIELTEGQLNGPTMKTLLSVVWGRNLSTQGFWAIYWTLLENHLKGKLGSGAPNTDEMLKRIVAIFVSGDN